MYNFLFYYPLENAHDSFANATAQCKIVTHSKFTSFINKNNEICTIDAIFSKCKQVEIMRKLEPFYPVHDPWIELNNENNMQWTLNQEVTHCGSQAGGRCGPLSKMVSIAKSTESLAQLFLSIFTIKLFEYVAKMTHIYAYKEWVTK